MFLTSDKKTITRNFRGRRYCILDESRDSYRHR